MKIAIFGAGSVGATLGEKFAVLNHEVCFGVPSPSSEKTQSTLAGINARVQTPMTTALVADAARGAEIIVIATPWGVTRAALEAAGDLSGKIVIDCTNPLAMDASGLHLALGFDTSGAEQIATWAPGAHVCKAFNQTGDLNMAQPEFGATRSVMFVCGDDAPSRETTRVLVESIGFEAIDAGQLVVARLLEPLAMLWIHLAFTSPLGRDFAFAILRRQSEAA